MKVFNSTIWKYYKESKRDLPWRKTRDPYKILVSETMLQQTQVSRVIPKYQAFLAAFPTIEALATAKRPEILKLWHGLGYNRRALNLKRASEIVVNELQGKLPKHRAALEKLPGIGQSTSGAILAFAYNIPETFIETNIRTVFLYFFFKNSSTVSDKEILTLVERHIDKKNPREWYFALYDYGTMLKTTLGRKSTLIHKQSKHYNKQSKFEGSNRQIRANIVSCFLAGNRLTLSASDIVHKTGKPLSSVTKNLLVLEKEGFLERTKSGRKGETTFKLHA